MAVQFADRIRCYTATTGTGTITIGSAVTGFRTFSGTITTGATVYYVIEDTGGAWETGSGVYTSGTETLTRTVQASSLGGTTALTLTGAAQVYCSMTAGLLALYPPAAGATLTGVTTMATARVTASPQETRVAMGANNIDLSAGSFFTKTVAANTTWTVSNVPASGIVSSLILELTNGGAFTMTWWSGVKWANGTAPTLTASGLDILGFYTMDGGTTWRGLLLSRAVA